MMEIEDRKKEGREGVIQGMKEDKYRRKEGRE